MRKDVDGMKQYKVASLFAGIGGICLGFKQAGFEIVWANEIDSAACRTYRHNFGNKYLVEDDIRNIQADALPNFNVLAAGFPCQPFSIAGKQMGFNDMRGNLFFDITRIVDKRRPEVIFLENVPNLLEHDNGRTFLVIYTSLSQFGYYVKYALLPAHQYGNLPQTRNRIYIVAFRDLDECDRFSFPNPIELTTKVSDIVNIYQKQNSIYYYKENDLIFEKIKKVVKIKGRIYNMHNGEPRQTRYSLCPTLVASMGTRKNRVPIVEDSYGFRKLTLRECLALQGFDKNFCFPNGVSMNDAYKQIGNSVCVPVVKRIAYNILHNQGDD